MFYFKRGLILNLSKNARWEMFYFKRGFILNLGKNARWEMLDKTESKFGDDKSEPITYLLLMASEAAFRPRFFSPYFLPPAQPRQLGRGCSAPLALPDRPGPARRRCAGPAR